MLPLLLTLAVSQQAFLPVTGCGFGVDTGGVSSASTGSNASPVARHGERAGSAHVRLITRYRRPPGSVDPDGTPLTRGGAGDELGHQTRWSRATQHINREAEWEELQLSRNLQKPPVSWASLALFG